MGCGGSRLGGAAAARAEEGGVVPLPAGIRPLLRRRLEEMKKRSHASVLKGNQTLSKKELLRHGSSEVDDGEEMEEKHDSLKLSAKVSPVPDHHVEEKKEVIYEKISSRDGIKEVKKQDEDNHHHDFVDDVAMNVNKEGDNGSNHNEHDKVINDKKDKDDSVDHDEGRMSNFDERMICPGSPSFRVYCIDVASDDDKEGKPYVLKFVLKKPKVLNAILHICVPNKIVNKVKYGNINHSDMHVTRMHKLLKILKSKNYVDIT